MSDDLYRIRFRTAQMTIAALNKYARHLPGCLHNPRMKAEYAHECTCGLTEAMATLRLAIREAPASDG